MTMIEVQPAQTTPALRALFREDVPAGLRCFAVLAGDNAGRIWTDDLKNPTWGIVQESAFGTLYLEGTFPDGLLLTPFVIAAGGHPFDSGLLVFGAAFFAIPALLLVPVYRRRS